MELLNEYDTGNNFARKWIKKFDQFKNCLIQKALLKGIHELTIRNCYSFFL